MDEKALRAHFERRARASLPPTIVDVARARKAGRRRLRIRRAGIPTASFAVVVAVGALFAGDVLPAAPAGRPATTHHANKAHPRKPQRAAGPMAPVSFDPLAIYATFGWLPPGFTVTNPDTAQLTTQSFANVTGPDNESVALTVYAAHRCSVSGPIWWPPKGTFQFAGGKRKPLPSRRYRHGLACDTGAPPIPSPIIPAGHLAGGRAVYLMLDQYGHPTALGWQYARDGWAIAQWQGRRPAQIRKMAARVRYRSNLHLAFPFRLTGIPADWKVAGAGSQVVAGHLTGYLLYIGPSQDREGITILIEAPYPNGCVNIGGTTTNVTFDGAAGVTRNGGQDACIANLHGMYVYASSDQPGGALGLLRHIQVLGPNPANWTTTPLG